MRFRSIAFTMLSLCAVSTATAQNAPAEAQCLAAPLATRDACQQSVDLFKYMATQMGTAIAGGNATLGQGGTLGGLPHFTVGLRANLVMGHVPELQTPSLTGIQQRTAYPVATQILGFPAVDASIGIFKGFPLALSNVGGIDLLVNAAYVPKVETDEVTVEPDTPLKIGYGVRVGLLQESLLVPGVSASYMIRDLPVTTITGTTSGSTMTVQDLDLKTKAWRVTLSKSLVLFTIAAGVGQDTYDASTTITATTPGGTVPPFELELPSLTRTNYFADFAMNILLVKLIGEIGMVSGGEVLTHNTFTTKADASRMYGSVGIRVGF
jgi:hypothetical protein